MGQLLCTGNFQGLNLVVDSGITLVDIPGYDWNIQPTFSDGGK